jgi:multiple sugar transport system permease protein
MRVRSLDLVETVLGEGFPPSQRFDNQSPDIVTLRDQTEGTVRCAALVYDFDKGDTITLTRDYDLGFATDRLERFQLYLKPDDTWHELDVVLETGGVRYRTERPFPLANYNWTMVTWQKPGPDDDSTKIKTWVLLHPDETAKNAFAEPGKARVTFTIGRSSFPDAVGAKFALNYIRVMEHIPFWRYVRVSVFLVLTNVIMTVFACSLVAYAFARLQWPGREFCFLLMLATLMIPGQVTMIPHFLIWKYVGAYNTLTPLWLGSAFGSAFFVFLLRQFLKGIPRDLEDAARIDGCGTFRIYWHLMLPLMKPSLAAIAIFTFMGTWNNFMGPLIYLADQRLYPLAFGLYAFSVQVGNNPALTMAGSLLMTLPVIVIFFFAQKYFIQGVTLTGMKG